VRLLATPIALLLALPAAAEVTKTVRTELTPAEAARFAVENLAGSIRVTAGAGDAVAIVATIHAESEALADTLRFERRTWKGGLGVVRLSFPVNEQREYRFPGAGGSTSFRYAEDGSTDDAGRVRIRVSRDSGVLLYAELAVQVPKRALDAAFYNRVGPVSASGVSGSLRFDTAGGDIGLDHVSGDVLADSGSGDVSAEAMSGSFRCDTGSGECAVRGFKGDRLSLDTGSGNLRLLDVEARVIEADTGSGDVEASLQGALRVTADTGSGDVRLRLPRAMSFELRADTGSGDVESGFSDALPILRRREVVGFRRGDGAVKIDVDTGSGDVTVDPL
jgi:Putative adhesin